MTMTQNNKVSLNKAKIEAIRKQAHNNMRLIMKKLNFRGYDQGSRLTGCCPVPHSEGRTPNDNDKAFSWDFDRKMWQCFTHRCHQINGSDVFALVQSVKECTFRQAVMWILGVLEKGIEDIQELDGDEVQKLDQLIKKRAKLVKHKQLEEDVMKHLTPSSYFSKRGFSDEVIKEFGCWGEWHKKGTYGEQRVVVPVYDPLDGYLIAFTCRILDDSLVESWRPKWCHCLNFAELRKKAADRTDEERFHASSVLFNLHRAKEHMGDPETIVITEGPGDVMRLWEAGVKNAVAVLGTGFSKHHKSLLHKVGCRRIICVLDGDDAGQKARNTVKKLCEGYFDYHEVQLTDGRDPGDYTPEQLRLVFKEYL